MNLEQIEVFDRSIRVWGQGTQLKLLGSTCVLVGLDACMCELGKNLVLSGLSVWLIDEEEIKEEDIECNFYFNKSEIAKKKADILKLKLEDITSLVKINSMTTEHEDITQAIDRIRDQIPENAACYLFTSVTLSLSQYNKIEEYSSKNNLGFFASFVIGSFGFAVSNTFNKDHINLNLEEKSKEFWLNGFKEANKTFKRFKKNTFYEVFQFYFKILQALTENTINHMEESSTGKNEKINSTILHYFNLLDQEESKFLTNLSGIDGSTVLSLKYHISCLLVDLQNQVKPFATSQVVAGILTQSLVALISDKLEEGASYLYTFSIENQSGKYFSGIL